MENLPELSLGYDDYHPNDIVAKEIKKQLIPITEKILWEPTISASLGPINSEVSSQIANLALHHLW